MKPELYIVNDHDRPAEKFIAEKRKDGKFFYINPDLADDKRYWGMTPDKPTPLEDFGIEIAIFDGRLYGARNHPSKASYSDGRKRNWQGDQDFSFPYPPLKEGEVEVMSVDGFIDALANGDSNDIEISALGEALREAAELLSEDALFELEQKLPGIFRDAR